METSHFDPSATEVGALSRSASASRPYEIVLFFVSVGSTEASGGESARLHRPARRYVGSVPARGARAAGEDTASGRADADRTGRSGGAKSASRPLCRRWKSSAGWTA